MHAQSHQPCALNKAVSGEIPCTFSEWVFYTPIRKPYGTVRSVMLGLEGLR